MNLFRAACAVALASLLGVLSAPPASAAATSTGVRGTIVGAGDDRLVGTTSRDVICGRGGDDVISGGRGGDDLEGQGGDDDLSGDTGADDLDGGLGTNVCIVDAADVSVRCRYDEQPPVMVETAIDPGNVDVTEHDVDVKVRVHATDDIGVEDVQVQLSSSDGGVYVDVPPLMLVSGEQRDGWWETTTTVPRWTKPSLLEPTAIVRDRLDRTQYDSSGPAGCGSWTTTRTPPALGSSCGRR